MLAGVSPQGRSNLSDYQKMLTKKKTKLIQLLNQEFPDPGSELNFNNRYQLLVAVMLSAQCTDKKVNQVTPDLFSKYPDFAALAKARIKSVESIIRPINYYRTKASNLVKTAKIVLEKFDRELPTTHHDLTSLPGVGQKTANVVLGELQITPTFPVDTHVFRVSRRLGLAQANLPEKVEQELKEQFPPELWRNMHHWLILHGRRVCKARNPLCSDCVLNTLCPSAFLDNKS